MLFGRRGGGSWALTIILSAVAITLTALTHIIWTLTTMRAVVLFLQLEGMALVACGLAPEDHPLNPGLKEWWNWFWERTMASHVGFNKPEFWTGLVLLGLAAILSAVAQ